LLKKNITIFSTFVIIIIITSIFYSIFFYEKETLESKRIADDKQNLKILTDKKSGKAPLTIYLNYKHNSENVKIISNEWKLGDGTTSKEKKFYHTYDQIGSYTITLTLLDENGLIKTNSTEIYVEENIPPKAKIKADKTSGRVPLKIEFTGNAFDKDGKITSYQWDFGDKSIIQNTTSNQQNKSYNYIRAGTYIVNFTVTDDNGAKDTKMIKIEVKPNLLTVCYRIFLYARWIINSIKKFINNFGGK
jgi:PKD repeat protein